MLTIFIKKLLHKVEVVVFAFWVSVHVILVLFWPDVHMIRLLLWLDYTYPIAHFALLLALFAFIFCAIVMQKWAG